MALVLKTVGRQMVAIVRCDESRKNSISTTQDVIITCRTLNDSLTTRRFRSTSISDHLNSGLHHSPRYHLTDGSTMPTRSCLLIDLESIDSFLDLAPQIRTVEASLRNYFTTSFFLTIPSQRIHTICWAFLLQYDTHCVGETDGIMGRIGWEEEHGTFGDGNVPVDGFIGRVGRRRLYNPKEHRPSVLKEVFGSCVDVIV